jgi:quercetin dioxygenase-like cupin family protein
METTTETPYSHFENLADSVTIASESIVSRTLHADKHTKSIVFGFDAGQELSEHTASVPATIHILRGEAEIQLGADKHEASAGSWAWMPAKLPHGIVAKTPVVMLLTMFTDAKEEGAANSK